MAKDAEGPTPISEDSIGYLEEVKKGKSRKFAMICKGTSVISLVVYKKGAVEKRKKEAKESGKGQFYFGVVEGKGIDIRFLLARADGFESPPVKSTELKNFLAESADMKCKPTFEIVDEAPLALDDDDPLVARFLTLRGGTQQACESHPDLAAEINGLCQQVARHLDQEQSDEATDKLNALESLLGGLGVNESVPQEGDVKTPPVSADALKLKLQEALSKLVPQLKQAVVTFPERKVELLTPVSQIKKQLDSGELQEAKQGILAVGQILKALMAQSKSPDEIQPQSQVEIALGVEFQRKLADLQPRYDQALKDGLGDTNKFQTVMTYAKEQAESNAFGNAIKAIDKLSQAIDQAIATGSDQPIAQSESNLRAEYERKLAELTPRYEEALNDQFGDTSKFRAAMSMATEQAAIGSDEGFQKAITIFDRLSKAIDQAIAAGTKETDIIPESVVSDRKKFLQSRWQEAIQAAYAEIENIAAPIASQVPDEDPQELVAAITQHLDAFVDELNQAIAGAQSASSTNIKPIDEALKAIQSYRSRIASDPLLAHLNEASSDLGVEVKVTEHLMAALDELEQRLAS